MHADTSKAWMRWDAVRLLTPHEWHAQAVFIVKLMERTLGDSVGFHILRAQYLSLIHI